MTPSVSQSKLSFEFNHRCGPSIRRGRDYPTPSVAGGAPFRPFVAITSNGSGGWKAVIRSLSSGRRTYGPLRGSYGLGGQCHPRALLRRSDALLPATSLSVTQRSKPFTAGQTKPHCKCVPSRLRRSAHDALCQVEPIRPRRPSDTAPRRLCLTRAACLLEMREPGIDMVVTGTERR
jgi:hypothetical protein